jgi:hypothetical protein
VVTPVSTSGAIARALTHLDEAVRISNTGLHRRLPFLADFQMSLPRMREQVAQALTHADAAVRELEGGDGRARAAIAGVRELSTRLRTEVGKAATPPYYGHELRLAPGYFGVARERLAIMQSVASLDDVAARTAIGQRLDDAVTRFLASPNHEDGVTLAAIHLLPDEVRPAGTTSRFGSTVWETWASTPHKHFSMVGSDIAESLPIGVEHRRLAATYAAAPAGTAERELDRLLDIPSAQLTDQDVQHMGVLTSLPPELRPAILDTPQPDREFSVGLVAMSGGRYSGKFTKSNVDAFRAAREAARLVETGQAGTKEANVAEVLRILEAPTARIDASQRRRISVLARLPVELRPDLPPAVPGEIGLEHVGLEVGPRLTARRIASSIDRGRAYLIAQHAPAELAEALRRPGGNPDGLDGVRLAALTSLGRPLEEFGISRALLSELFTRHLAGAGATWDSKASQLVGSLQHARDDIATRQLPAALEPLRSEMLELADRNLGRMLGLRHDTFGSHPDYAEIGRLTSMLELVNRAETLAASKAVDSSTLVW